MYLRVNLNIPAYLLENSSTLLTFYYVAKSVPVKIAHEKRLVEYVCVIGETKEPGN